MDEQDEDHVIIKYNVEESLKLYNKIKNDSMRNFTIKRNNDKNIIADLNLSHFNGIIDCELLKKINIYSLNLSYISKLKNPKTILNITQLNVCSSDNIIDLSFVNCNKLKKLNTNSKSNKLNLNKFKNLEHLIITNCDNLKDISNLTKLKELKMTNCDKIQDIGNLREIKRLRIDRPVNGLHLLNKLEEVSFSGKYGNINSLLKSNYYLKLKKTNKKIKIV